MTHCIWGTPSASIQNCHTACVHSIMCPFYTVWLRVFRLGKNLSYLVGSTRSWNFWYTPFMSMEVVDGFFGTRYRSSVYIVDVEIKVVRNVISNNFDISASGWQRLNLEHTHVQPARVLYLHCHIRAGMTLSTALCQRIWALFKRVDNNYTWNKAQSMVYKGGAAY